MRHRRDVRKETIAYRALGIPSGYPFPRGGLATSCNSKGGQLHHVCNSQVCQCTILLGASAFATLSANGLVNGLSAQVERINVLMGPGRHPGMPWD